ncbi:MAG: hypothetical protein JWN34_2017 [Bryobacterales bacterium]|nr:hypothetical protein [Bryobacterales bacterium]
MLADLLIRPPVLTLAGAVWPILFDHAALLEIERLTGLDVLAGDLDLWQPNTKQLRAALWAALRRAGYTGTLNLIGSLMSALDLPEIRRQLIEGWIASMPEPDEEQDPDEEEGEPLKRSKLELWAEARFDLRLSDSEWLAMTPRQVDHLRRRQLAKIRHEELCAGITAAAVANFSGRLTEGRGPDSFMLHPYPAKADTIDDILRATAHLPRTEGSI